MRRALTELAAAEAAAEGRDGHAERFVRGPHGPPSQPAWPPS